MRIIGKCRKVEVGVEKREEMGKGIERGVDGRDATEAKRRRRREVWRDRTGSKMGSSEMSIDWTVPAPSNQ
jgi:hypothetical protein